MPVVGTAGHVDHGKSTLVRALTGRDPDRWDEEKRRGLTIDLGFAWTKLDSGTTVGFVDVPGHERFIKNMLAGVDAIEVAVFAVAADEGWMPQSEEHLAVLDLLGVSAGIVALTRADLVDEDTIELMMLEIDDRLAGTSLEGAPIIPTSVPGSRGIEELRATLDSVVSASPTADRGRPRLWVDRAFTIEGAGTVVTGTLLDGTLRVDDNLVLFPARTATRIRSIQSHEESVPVIGPGNRTALNLASVEREAIERGAMLGVPGQWHLSSRFTADARTVRSLGDPLREQGSFHLHVGSGSWPVRIRLLEGESLAGTGAMIIDSPVELPLRTGDRFILREVGRRAVVAGGRVLDPGPPRRLREAVPMLPALRAATTPDEAAAALLDTRGQESLNVLSAHSGGGEADFALATERTAFSARRIDQLLRRAGQAVAGYHQSNPLRSGMPKASLAGLLRIEVDELEAVLDISEELVTEGPAVRDASFAGELDGSELATWETLRSRLQHEGFMPTRRKELEVEQELLHALIRSGRLIEISSDLVYLPETLDEIVALTRTLDDGLTVAEFRDRLEITRKYAVPLLEWMDAAGVTRRQGEERAIRRPQPGGPGPGDAPSR